VVKRSVQDGGAAGGARRRRNPSNIPAIPAQTEVKVMTKSTSSEEIMRSADAEAVAETAMARAGLPPKQGLYDPRNEHDACGVGFIAHM
jgi:hypothetical protein